MKTYLMVYKATIEARNIKLSLEKELSHTMPNHFQFLEHIKTEVYRLINIRVLKR